MECVTRFFQPRGAQAQEHEMALFYKGAGVGTFLHSNDPRISGVPPRAPAMAYNAGVAMRHIARGTAARLSAPSYH
jgi:hypothetical protein